MGDVTAIILAAGLSRRMGARNKLLLPIGDTPMIRHVVDIYEEVTTQSILVVTGYQAEAVEAALAGSCARTVFNPKFANGQPTSVACGLREAPGSMAVLIGLGDQPLLTGNDLRLLLTAHHAGDIDRISIPKQGDQRGNPIVVPAVLRELLLADEKSLGCKAFTRDHPEHIQFHELASVGFYTDVDTAESYEALKSYNPKVSQ